ncbi:PIN domain-containing protein [Litoribacter alkaliphilus]|uniref:PIN domain-containing protein n=1 Tax=Litoribacter ruber TaxID=702568 RepID=A0AAP2G0E9_9BACT|nr:PIN domain-containing protein [Litoribacter alkaliphilus]MBS9522679.1 PIN domain-containing protein [Litoribacter alkaliphilus]
MKIFLDACVLVSVLNQEYPLYSYSSRILSLQDNPRFQVYTSPICLAIAFYFSEKKSGRIIAKRKLALLSSKIKIAGVDHDVVRKASEDKSVEDFEDGLEYYAALKAGCKVIVTENQNDFYFSKLEIAGSREFLRNYF